jgi:lysozyme
MSRFDASLLARALEYVGRPRKPEKPLAADVEPASAVDIAAALCRRFEGFFSRPYICPAGVPTIGYGATHYMDGTRVKLTDAPISRETAERLLIMQIKRIYLPAVLRQCPALVYASAERLAAIIDWTFNLGEGNLRASALRRKLNAGDWDAVPGELRKWVIGGGVVLRGLVLRRNEEARLVG